MFAPEIVPPIRATLPGRLPAALKEESGIRERSSVPSEALPDIIIDDEESHVYLARREAFKAYHELQSSIIKLVDLGLTHLKLDQDARDILLDVRQFPSAVTPLYEPYRGRRPATIFAQHQDKRAEKLWGHLARLSYDLKTLKNKAQVAEKAVHTYEEKQRASHTLLASYFDPAL
jgi:hypothetical protein